MTRKHFEAIADALNRAKPLSNAGLATWQFTVNHVADALERINPRFDRKRFLTAAGL